MIKIEKPVVPPDKLNIDGKQKTEQDRFRGEVPFAIDGNLRGKTTIDALRLDKRDGLREARLQRLQIARDLWFVIQEAARRPENLDLQNLARQAKERFNHYSQANQEYASAMRSAIATNFRHVIG
ncbi:MAG: hypothetical protein HC860_01775 [Alkalinema sp. RU_4_3]|nr:hypothetical protein [Alkalinema sp. RU_4_3]